jgi:hypothetical protein
MYNYKARIQIGKQAVMANGLLRGSGAAVAGRIGFGALALSTVFDVAKTGAAIDPA